ncbi:MAG: class I SAM-dependent methyltransferase [Ignavibacteriaceae bacterium]|nr:class I SAM-dependent methyltransferase [Ignavibacteriaceae bacterium]
MAKFYNWLIFSLVNPRIKLLIDKYANGIILDIGCGEKPYRNFTLNSGIKHIGIDHIESLHNRLHVDVVSNAYGLPFKENTFNFILCTYVLEHLEEPAKSIKEALRVLKSNAYAVYVVPFFWHLHEEPRDFFRYSIHGLQYLFEKNGFVVVDIIPVSGFIVTFTQEMCYYLLRFRAGGIFNPLWWLIPPFLLFIQLVSYFLNKIDHSTEFSIEYIAVVRKR